MFQADGRMNEKKMREFIRVRIEDLFTVLKRPPSLTYSVAKAQGGYTIGLDFRPNLQLGVVSPFRLRD